VYIPKYWHSAVIGKSGANVQHLKDTFGVTITIPRAEDPSTQVTVTGDKAADAIAFMEQKLGFGLSRTPLVELTLDVGASEATSLFKGNALAQDTKLFGIGARVPRADGEFLVVQGPQAGINKAIQSWSTRLGRTVSDKGKAAAFEHKVEIHDSHIAETIFFGDGDADDEHDLCRFIEFLRSGSNTLDICVFTITCDRIAKAIENEFRQGVKVRLITDNNTAGSLGSDISKLAKIGIPVKIDVSEGHMHHKFCVIDNKLMMTGSFNWTRGASTANYENVLVSNDATFVKEYHDAFEKMWNDSKRFVDFSG
jgi:HKD family nuclease